MDHHVAEVGDLNHLIVFGTRFFEDRTLGSRQCPETRIRHSKLRNAAIPSPRESDRGPLISL